MSPNDDDLSAFHDDPLFRALTGPGTADELGGEAEALAAFRAAVPVRRRRYGRLGIAGSVVGVAIAFSGASAAAAANGVFPAPMQNVAHDLFDPILQPIGIDVPPAKHHATTASKSADVTSPPTTPATPIAAPTPTATPSTRHSAKPKPTRKPKAKPTGTPTAKPTGTPVPVTTPTVPPTGTPTPTPTSTAPAPADSITISLSTTTVSPGGTVTAYGKLASSAGDPIVGQNVWLIERVPGQAGVAEVASGTTGAGGSVSFTSPALAHSVRLRLVTGTRVRSAAIGVIVQPTISATVTPGTSNSVIRIDTNGGVPGDIVNVYVRRDGTWQLFVSTELDGQGGATIGAQLPTRGRDHYRVVLPRTPEHGSASTTFTVAAS